MSKLLQLRGGTTSQHSSFTGAVREVTVDTDKDTLVVHDGSTAGGFALPRTGAEIVALVEGTSDSNTFTDADHTKLNGIAASANNYTHPNHSGEVTSTADGATVIVDNIVDEANLKISNAGSNGQFLSKQSGDTGGLTWATVTMEDFIPNGTVMCFFQSAAPTGWTKLTSQNDKVLRVVSGTGGGTGGVWATASGLTTDSQGAHTHTSAAHTHTSAAHTHGGGSLAAGAHTLSISEMPSHGHPWREHPSGGHGSSGTSGGFMTNDAIHGAYLASQTSTDGPSTAGASDSVQIGGQGGSSSHSHSLSGTSASTTPGATGSTTPGATGSAGAHTHTITAPAYIDVIICSKDA